MKFNAYKLDLGGCFMLFQQMHLRYGVVKNLSKVEPNSRRKCVMARFSSFHAT